MDTIDKQKIGNLLISLGYITEEQKKAILYEQSSNYDLFGEIAIKKRIVHENDLYQVLSKLYKVKFVDLDFLKINPKVAKLLPQDVADHCIAIPFELKKYVLHIAMSDPGDTDKIDTISRVIPQYNLVFYISSRQKILRAIALTRNEGITEHSAVPYLNGLLSLAVEQGASDLHFMPTEDLIIVKARINGILQEIKSFPATMWGRIRSRLKVISNLNIAESRRPQSGHATILINEKKVDLRISTHPSIFGECVAVRILDANNGLRRLDELNFPPEDISFFNKIMQNSHGMFLIVGPTGSGKTTTLYSLLQEINDGSLNIMTLEDPVEFQIPGIKQLDLRDEGLISFADGIKSILRQDPDVILVGEIRDENTAKAVLRASLTGRLVLATLHSSTPIEALQRLSDLGVDMHELATQLRGIFSQRLLRQADHRVPVSEYFECNKEIRAKIAANSFDIKLNKSFRESVKVLISSGLVEPAEVIRVLGHAYL